MRRYADIRIDASSIKELPDGSIKVVGQLTQPGIFTYRNDNGTPRREYRPKEEVFSKSAMATFSAAPVTINHPKLANGQRIVSAESWKGVAIGHLGENIREDGGQMVADIYVRDADAVKRVKSGDLRHISCGYNVDYEDKAGVTEDGQRYDGVQRNIRGNHVALLPSGVAPRGGSECVLRLDSQGDEIRDDAAPDEAAQLNLKSMELEALKAQITALQTELAKSRTDAAGSETVKTELAAVKAELAALQAQLAPERLDSLVEARATAVASAKSVEVETTGKSTLQIKRAIVAKKTPDLATRVDSLSEEAVDAILAVYKSEPHPTLKAAVAVVGSAPETRSDAVSTDKVISYTEMYNKHVQASRDAWKNTGDKA